MLKLPSLFAPATGRAFAALTSASLSLSGGVAVPGAERTPATQPTTQPATQIAPAPTPLGILQALRTLPEVATVELDISDAAFSQAVARLERCRTAQSQAERQAARGALSRRALASFRDATEKAQALVEKLQELRTARQQANSGVTIVVDGGGFNNYSPTAAPIMPRPLTVRQPGSLGGTASTDTTAATPRTARITPPNFNVTVSVAPPQALSQQGNGGTLAENPPRETPSPRPDHTTTARPLLSAALPALTRPASQGADGTISAPVFSNWATLDLPHRTGARPAPTPLASLPATFGAPKPVASMPAVTAPVATPPVAVPPVAAPPVAAPSVATMPKIVVVPPVVAPAAVPTPVAPVKPPTNTQPAPTSNEARTRLAQLAQLEAQLNHAEKRLNAADAALNEGQRQLAQFASTLRQAMLEAGPEATGLHPFVKIAEKYAGTPYVWGGESRGGFDCSGLIILVMRELGYKTPPHSAAEQFKYGTPIAQPLLKPGDLVFFANTYKPGISHVGIYLGKRRFIHAAGTGKGTIVSSLDTPKYQEKYAGGRRLVQIR